MNKKQYIIVLSAFVLGGLVFKIFGPEKIQIKKEVEIQEKTVEKEIEKKIYIDRVIEKIVEKKVKEKVVKNKITYPDGTIVESEVYESELEQLDRMKELEKQNYEEKLALVEKEYKEKLTYSKTTTNPKYTTVYLLGGVRIDGLQQNVGVGAATTLWGPFTVGGQATYPYGIAGTIGFRF